MAVRTRAQLNADANVNLPDNESGDIDAVHVRDRVKDLADSALLPEDVGTAAGTVAAGNDTRFPVMPHDFTTSVGIGNATKDTEALLAWAAYISANDVGKARLSGKSGAAASFLLAEPLIIGPSGGTIPTQLIECNATIRAVAALDDMVYFRNFWSSTMTGRLHVHGGGGEGISNNLAVNGIRFAASGSARFGHFLAESLLGWAVRNTGGNTHFATIEKIRAANCGARGSGSSALNRNFQITITGFEDISSGNGQRTVLTLDDPADLPPGDLTWAFIYTASGSLHHIREVDYDLGTLSIYPFMRTADKVPGPFNMFFGGGLQLGGQSAKTTVNAIVTNRCGTSLWLHGVGTPVVHGHGCNHDAIAIALGIRNTAVFGGARINGSYAEATTFHVVQISQTSSASHGTVIDGLTAYVPSRMVSLKNRNAGGVEADSRYFPVSLVINNQQWFPWTEQQPRSSVTQPALTSATISNVPRPYMPMRRVSNATFTVNLVDDANYRDVKGSVPLQLLLTGRGSRKGTFGGYNGTIIISAETGYTINDSGFQSLSITGPEKPCVIRAWLEDDGSGPTIWRVTIEELNIFAGTEATPVFPGNITDLDVVATTSSTVTLEFTEATNADYYEYRHSLNNSPGDWGGIEILAGSAASGTFTGTVEGLDANEVYDFQVRGVNDNGPGEWSNTATASTVMAPSTISDLTVPRTTISSAVLRFSPSINAASYEVRHSITTENEWTEDDLGVIEAGAFLEGEVEGLEEDEAYDFQVRGVIAGVVGAWSNLVTATAEVTLPGDIDDLDIVAATYENFTLGFTEATNADLGYQVRYSVTTLDEWTEVTLSGSASGGVFTGVLADLAPGVTYDVQVRGVNAEGPGEWSNLVTGATSALLHYQIDTFTASGTWTAPEFVETVDYAEGWGAGGGSSYDEGTTTRMSGGGSAYARKANIEVTPETGYTVTVAAASATDTDGGDSSFIDGSTLLVKGGKAGINGRTGGQASESVGDVTFSGGTGITSTSASIIGGGAAGDQGAASGTIPGERQPGLGLGGVNRVIPGGGAGSATTTGAGARGEIRIHYKRPVPAGFAPVVSRNWGRTTAQVTSHPINMPPNLAVGNLLLCHFSVFHEPDLTIPDGWTVLSEIANGANNKMVLLYKHAEGGDSLTITSSTSRRSQHFTWQIATAGVPTATTATGSSTSNDPPEHTPPGGLDKYLWLALRTTNHTGNMISLAPPANYGSFNYMASVHNVASGSITSAVAERFLEASAENPGAFTASNSSPWVAATVAIPFVEVAPPSAEFEFIGTNLSADNLTTYTFTGVPIGTATEDRRVIIAIGGGGNTNAVVTAASIGGHTADVYSMTDSASRLACATISAIVPAGTTATVTVTFAAAQQRCSLHVHRARRLQSGVPVDWVADHAHATIMEADLDVLSGGFIIAGSMYGNTSNTNHHVSCASRAVTTTGTKEISVERTAIDNVEWAGLDQDSDVLLEAHDTAIGNFVTLAATSWR